jgi:uncharacterized short protein YbdD (DUF466 family)
MRDERNVGNERNVGKVRNVGNEAGGVVPPVPSFPTFPSFPSFLRQLAGMPDYGLHVEHLRQSHPDQRIPTEREYFEEYLRSRYHPGRTRCC